MAFTKLNTAIEKASNALLQGKEGEANELLSEVYDELLIISSTLPASNLEKLQPVMQVMLKAQQERDYVYLVDILKYQLLGFFKNTQSFDLSPIKFEQFHLYNS